MLTLTLRDLQFRLRQFLIAIIGAALAFTVLLILTGISEGFNTEAEDTVDAVNADTWVVRKGVAGPFASVSSLPAAFAQELNRTPGVRTAAPFVAVAHTLKHAEGDEPVNVIGAKPGGPGDPEVTRGDPLRRAGQAIVNPDAGVETGDSFSMGEQEFRVVGEVEDRTYLGGAPAVYLTVPDAQELAFNGEPLANAVTVVGHPEGLARGYTTLTNEAVIEDMLRPLDGARQVIDTIRVLMWIVAMVIIGAVMYLSALERLRDFAVLKAVGGESRSLALGLSVQAVIASLAAAILASILSALLRPLFPVPVTISADAYLILAGVALFVGLLASVAALRRVLKVDPALAFG
jgi:putative ABC transport system permease protein